MKWIKMWVALLIWGVAYSNLDTSSWAVLMSISLILMGFVAHSGKG